jgi:hypothetical protein
MLEGQGPVVGFRGDPYEPLQELNLDVSTEELLSAERVFTYVDLYAMLGDKDTVAWLTPRAAVACEHGHVATAWNQLDRAYSFSFSADGKEMIAFARSHEHLLEICDIVVRLLAASVVHSVGLTDWNPALFIHAPTLEYLMEQCQSLKVLALSRLEMDEDHCRVLGAYSRPDLEIVLDSCTITDAGASTLVEVLRRNQGPTKLDDCEIDNVVLANGLRGNSRLKSLEPSLSEDSDVGNRQVLAIAGALRENKGLVHLDLSYELRLNDETWGAICDSLKTHPTLEVLHLWSASAPAVIKPRVQALLDMLKVNMTIHTMYLNAQYVQHELYRKSVIPYLETNQFRPRLLAIQQTRPITYRAKVLGRALLSARTDPNRFWMLLSGNAEVAFPPTTATTTTAAASLPTPATAAATVNVAPVVATAASNVVAPASGQKRKACP